MDISELNSRDVEYGVNFYTASDICRDPIVLTTDEQTRFLAILGYKQSDRSNSTNAYIVVWDVTTKKTVVRIETNSNILNIFASPKSKGLFCLSKNRFSFLYPLKEGEATSTTNFQSMRKLERESCELHEWTWDPSDPPMTSSEEIYLNSSHGKQYNIDLLTVKKNDLEEKNAQRQNNKDSSTSSKEVERNRVVNGILEISDNGNASIGPIPELILKTTTLSNGDVVHLIGQFVTNLNHSSIIIVNADTGSVIDKVIFNGYLSSTSVMTENFEVRGNRLLLQKFYSNRATQSDMLHSSASEIIFFDLETRCEIDSYSAHDLCNKPQSKCGHGTQKNAKESKDLWIEEAKYSKTCRFIAKFDANPRRKQFLVFNQNLTLYQLMNYDTKDMTCPQILVIGSTYVYELTERTFDNVLLSNGVLFSAPIFESYPRMNKEYHQFRDAATLAVFAINIYDEPKATKCTIISIMEDREGLESGLMNDCSRTIFWDKKDKKDANFAGISKFTQRFIHLVDDYTLTVSIGNATYLHIDLSLSGIEVAEREATQLYKRQLVQERLEKERQIQDAEIQRIEKEKEAKRKVKDKERVELIEKLRKKYVDKDGEAFVLQGKIHTWKKSYGFVRAKGEAKDLGNIFVHITDVKNKKKGKYPNRNKWIQFYAKYDPTQSSLRAADVILLDKSLSNDYVDAASPSLPCNGNIATKTSETLRAPSKSQAKKDNRNRPSKSRYPRQKKNDIDAGNSKSKTS